MLRKGPFRQYVARKREELFMLALAYGELGQAFRDFVHAYDVNDR